MSYNKSISASDPQAVEKLSEKLSSCQVLQTTMKEVNAYWRKKGTCIGAPGITDAQAAKLEAKITAGRHPWDNQPFASYDLTNNNAEIKRLEKRIAEISRNRDVGFVGWEFTGGNVEANSEMDRLQVFFDERPDSEKCVVMKRNGFKWAPTLGAWQRQLNDNAIRAASWIDFIKPSDGRTVREIQPKTTAK